MRLDRRWGACVSTASRNCERWACSAARALAAVAGSFPVTSCVGESPSTLGNNAGLGDAESRASAAVAFAAAVTATFATATFVSVVRLSFVPGPAVAGAISALAKKVTAGSVTALEASIVFALSAAVALDSGAGAKALLLFRVLRLAGCPTSTASRSCER